MDKAYRIELTQSEASAISWHGHRYEFPELLDKALQTTGDDDKPLEVCFAEFTEAEAWTLKEAWENDGETLACGSRDLCAKCQDFINKIV